MLNKNGRESSTKNINRGRRTHTGKEETAKEKTQEQDRIDVYNKQGTERPTVGDVLRAGLRTLLPVGCVSSALGTAIPYTQGPYHQETQPGLPHPKLAKALY